MSAVHVALNLLKVAFFPFYGCIKIADWLYWTCKMDTYFLHSSTFTIDDGVAIIRFTIVWLFAPMIIWLYKWAYEKFIQREEL